MTQATDRRSGVDTVVLDLDGTLVDSVYHHTVAWQLAFHEVGLDVAAARIHGAIGMGGDRLVAHLAGRAAENAVGDHVRALHDKHFLERVNELRALDGASDLVLKLRAKGFRTRPRQLGRRRLDRPAAVPGRREWRPARDRVGIRRREQQACSRPDRRGDGQRRCRPGRRHRRRGVGRAWRPGSAAWDASACSRVASARVTSGAAGAAWVFDSPRDLLDNLESSPLA